MYKKLFVILLLSLSFVSAARGRVHMSDINAVTFTSGYRTRSRRGETYPQMQLDRHTPRAIRRASPSSIQCYQQAYNAFNGESHWECVADLPRGVKLGNFHISCEGYDYPGDEFVLDGSCAINYRLERAKSSYKYSSSFTPITEKRSFELSEMLVVVFIVVVFIVLIKGCSMYHDTTASHIATAAVSYAVGRATAPRRILNFRRNNYAYSTPLADVIEADDTRTSTSHGTGSSR